MYFAELTTEVDDRGSVAQKDEAVDDERLPRAAIPPSLPAPGRALDAVRLPHAEEVQRF